MAKKLKPVGTKNVLARVRKRLAHADFKWEAQHYLDTGNADLNRVLGSEEKGFPYGRMLEIAGDPSQGKTVLAMDLAAVGQEEGATVIWIDFEASLDPVWCEKRGLKFGEVVVLAPYVGMFGKEKTPRLCTAEELLEEAEQVLVTLGKDEKRKRKFILVIDSVAAMLTEAESGAGIADQNMKSRVSLAMTLGQLCRRWVGLMQTYNGLCIFINQIREKPMAFGDPTYTVGGKAVPFFCHSRVRMRRKQGGKIVKNRRVVGIKGVITNVKNKSGGNEGESCAYWIYSKGTARFGPAEDLE